jgi:hypothetical protein
MPDFFKDQKQMAARGLNILSINDYRDIHLATLQVLEQTGVFVEDHQALAVFGSNGALVGRRARYCWLAEIQTATFFSQTTRISMSTSAVILTWSILIPEWSDNPPRKMLPPQHVCVTL